jgi:hypothetical protein
MAHGGAAGWVLLCGVVASPDLVFYVRACHGHWSWLLHLPGKVWRVWGPDLLRPPRYLVGGSLLLTVLVAAALNRKGTQRGRE